MTRALALIWACACTADAPGRPDSHQTRPGETGFAGPTVASTTTTGPTTPSDRLVASGPIPCADPSLRVALGPWHNRTAPALAITDHALVGGGVVAGDLDGDGWLELFLAAETSPELWRTVPDAGEDLAAFFEITDPVLAGLDLDGSVGGTAADFDGDGWTDLVISRWERPNVLLRNDGNGYLEDVTPPAMRDHALRTQSATVGDIDGDGDLDLVFGNYGMRPEVLGDPNLPAADPTEAYEQVDGEWVDRSDAIGAVGRDGYTFATGLYDLDDDLLPELLVANDFAGVHPSVVLRNRGGWVFEEEQTLPDWGVMGMAVGDVNGDARPDLFLSSWRYQFLLASGEALGLPGIWVDVTDASGVQMREDLFGWAVDFGDLDNDGDLDAPMIYGAWSDWPALAPELEADALYIQTAPMQFEDQAAAWGFSDVGVGRGMVVADVNQDGWLDILKRQLDRPNTLRVSRCGDAAWLVVTLAAPSPNTAGIGARVQVTTGDTVQTRWITAGSTGLYAGNPIEAHFGLGAADLVDQLEVLWPDGRRSVFADVPGRQRVTVVRGAE